MVRFTKITKDGPLPSQVDNEKIIKACFEPCTPAVQNKVKHWLDNCRCRQITLYFKEYKVRLEKI